MKDVKSTPEIIAKYGYGVCDGMGGLHCVGRCQDTKDCGARPIPENAEEAGKWRVG